MPPTRPCVIEQLARQVRQGFFGEEVQRLPRDGEDVRVYVRYPRADRESLDFLQSIRIRTNDGRELLLGAVADLRFEKGTNRILRRERQRAIIVSAEFVTDRIDDPVWFTMEPEAFLLLLLRISPFSSLLTETLPERTFGTSRKL